MAIITIPTKWVRIIVWVLDIVVLALVQAQEIFEGFSIPDWGDGVMAAVAIVLSVFFGIIWNPSKNKPPVE